jgi:hypothetical protein
MPDSERSLISQSIQKLSISNYNRNIQQLIGGLLGVAWESEKRYLVICKEISIYSWNLV